jgi:hypothetical protein
MNDKKHQVVHVKKRQRKRKINTGIRVGIDTGETMTEQAHKKECDINYILDEYTRTGYMQHAKDFEGKYDDISVQDFQEAQLMIAQAKTMFAELPSQIQADFDHKPEQFLQFVQDPDNAEKLEAFGIIKGNDGVDINGISVKSPTQESLDALRAAKQKQKQAQATPEPKTPEPKTAA